MSDGQPQTTTTHEQLLSAIDHMSERVGDFIDQDNRAHARIDGKLDQIDETLKGNGKVGLIIRLDRLEQAKARADRINNGLIVGVSILILQAVLSWIGAI